MSCRCPICGTLISTPQHQHSWKVVGEARAIDWDPINDCHILGPSRPIYKCDCGKYKWETFGGEEPYVRFTLPSQPLPKYIKSQLEGKKA